MAAHRTSGRTKELITTIHFLDSIVTGHRSCSIKMNTEKVSESAFLSRRSFISHLLSLIPDGLEEHR